MNNDYTPPPEPPRVGMRPATVEDFVTPPPVNQTRPINQPNTVIIDKVLNGYIIKVGCQTVVFESLEVMVNELEKYFNDPRKLENEYIKKYGR
jgi:hypothetical protein